MRGEGSARTLDPPGPSPAGAGGGDALRIRNLSVHFAMPNRLVRAVNDVSIEVRQGETLGVVGESGSGKSVTFLSVLGIVRPPGRIVSGSIELGGRDLARMSAEELRDLRGRGIAMVFQDPQTSLNPVFPVGRQIIDVIRAHEPVTRAAARRRALEMLDLVGIPEPQRRFNTYPHQFSGGMRQRVLIAMALALNPRFVIADEPTTALDVTMQAQILDLLQRLKRDMSVGLVVITHDLGVIARIADRVSVMYAGRVVEQGDVETIFHGSRHPYALSLMRSMPRVDQTRTEMLLPIPGAPPSLSELPSGCAFHPRCFLERGREVCRARTPALEPVGAAAHISACHYSAELIDGKAQQRQGGAVAAADRPAAEAGRRQSADVILDVEDVRVHFPVGGLQLPWRRQTIKAVDGVSFSVRRGETISLVGESGCGKSTLGRAVVRLLRPKSGRVAFRGQDITHLAQRELRDVRRHMQMVFQDPYASLDPRMTVLEILKEPLLVRGLWDSKAKRRILELMERVGLSPDHVDRRPHEFSGGQRQRIGIARALALNPDLIVLDEPVSALDVSVQAQIINLLMELQRELNLTYIFIAHDLSVVRHISDRVMVMYLGRIVESGERDSFFAAPRHPYSRALLSAVPIPDPRVERTRQRETIQGGVPSPITPPAGCHFHPRCARAARVAAAGPAGVPIVERDGRKLPNVCIERFPDLAPRADERRVACHFPDEA